MEDRNNYKPYKVIAEENYEKKSKTSRNILYRKKGLMPYGEINSRIARDLQGICYSNVKKLKMFITEILDNAGYSITFGEDFIYAYCGGAKEEKVMLTAHLDTVHNPKGAKIIYVDFFNYKHYLWSPHGIGGDDRCGVLAIKRIIEKGYRPTVLFCDKEESGGLGVSEFSNEYNGKLNLNCIIKLDYNGYNNLVFYEDNNEDWKQFLKNLTGWKEEKRSFNNNYNPYNFGCASVNLSVGYYNQHTKDEYIVLEDLENSICIIEKIMNSVDKKWECKVKKYL